ncbi:geranylgeranyl reductase family protein [Desulfosoma sp.]
MTDCIVVGAGPAGACAARRAAERGLKTVCFEKERFPRHKPCGGALSMNGVKALGFALPETVQEGLVYGLRAIYGDRRMEARRSRPIAVMVRREAFDHLLMEKARESGAEIHMEQKVLRLEETEAHVTVETSTGVYQSRYVILAHGATGILNRRHPGPGTKGPRWKAVTRRFDASAPWLCSRKDDGMLEFFFDAYPHGYGWVFPLRGAFSIGVGGLHHSRWQTGKAFGGFLTRLGASRESRYSGSAIPCCGIAPVLGSRRILYAGDAGGFGEAFSGEGIFYAMRSGQLAADTIADAVQGTLRLPLPQAYRSRCLQVLGDNLIYAAFFARWVYWFPGFFVALFARKPQWARDFLGIPMGETTYKRFLLNRFSRGLLGNTGR